MRLKLQNPQANKRNPTSIKLKAVSLLGEKIEVTREEGKKLEMQEMFHGNS
jgi:hypothetical protein